MHKLTNKRRNVIRRGTKKRGVKKFFCSSSMRKCVKTSRRNSKKPRKILFGGLSPEKINIKPTTVFSKTNPDIPVTRSVGSCVKELVKASYKIYSLIMYKSSTVFERASTIICGGQSPSYYCLAMMNLPIYNPELVNIVILPHSKHGEKSKNQYEENEKYCQRLKEKGIEIRDHVYIIDGIHTGTGVLALQSALTHCFGNIKDIKKIAINADNDVAKIPVDYTVIVPCEPLFSDVYPRLVQRYYPRDFHDGSKFITEFIGIDRNPIAQMIISIAKEYPEIENNDWYKLNSNPGEEDFEPTIEYPTIKEIIRRESRKKLKLGQEPIEPNGYFTPIVLTNPKRYQCPECGNISGTAAPKNPSDLSLFAHKFDCTNANKIPIEPPDSGSAAMEVERAKGVLPPPPGKHIQTHHLPPPPMDA